MEILRDMIKHSMTINGHRTSLSLEPAFWQALRSEAMRQGISTPALVAKIDIARTQDARANAPANAQTSGLASAIRVYLLQSALNTTQ